MIKKYKIGLLVSVVALTACNSFLDELPDNRTELDTPDKVAKILVNAYPENSGALLTELSSDNIDDYGEAFPYTQPVYNQLSMWEDADYLGNPDVTSSIWDASYRAIANANAALDAIEKLGNPENLKPYKGEALLCRAYAHFQLVTLFAKHYNQNTSNTDLGVPYAEKLETELEPKYTRGTVAEVYTKINKDLEEGLPLITDNAYTVPKYHFNRAAAYAFAARFNLFYEKWDKAIEYANVSLGANPSTILRDWQALNSLNTNEEGLALAYIKETNSANFMMLPYYSSLGIYFWNYAFGSRFTHGRRAAQETILAQVPGGTRPVYKEREYLATGYDKVVVFKCPPQMEYTDKSAGIGYYHGNLVVFSADETLLVRAEAYIHKKDYTHALADMNLFASKFLTAHTDVTKTDVDNFYNAIAYSTDAVPTQKKKLNPQFTVDADQENMIHCVLQYRRMLTIHEGLRWYDILRYGIEVPRRLVAADGVSTTIVDRLTSDDLRRVIQIPSDVVASGIPANPR